MPSREIDHRDGLPLITDLREGDHQNGLAVPVTNVGQVFGEGDLVGAVLHVAGLDDAVEG